MGFEGLAIDYFDRRNVESVEKKRIKDESMILT